MGIPSGRCPARAHRATDFRRRSSTRSCGARESTALPTSTIRVHQGGIGERATEEAGADESAVRQLVVIGSSAGGIEALAKLLPQLPADFPAPVVVAQHLDPDRTSSLESILSKRSPLRVESVGRDTLLRAGVVYVVPSNQNAAITDHEVSLLPPGSGPKPSIDTLLSSAAGIFRENLVAVVLTGTGSDGAAGAEEVKRFGGTVVIQDPRTAQFPGLPLSLAPTAVDLSVPLDDMGPKILSLLTGPRELLEKQEDALAEVLRHIEEHSAVDFSKYKRPTIIRRLQRRMVATDSSTIQEYLKRLTSDPDESRALVSSFLIKVTEFFRDRELFDALRTRIMPAIIEHARRSAAEIRIWSAGCATGEEAYSLAILLADLLGDDLTQFHVRIFATDLDQGAIEFARRGTYPVSAVQSMPDELLVGYFTRTGNEYTVKKNIRSLMLFGAHDLGDRPPFPRIDLLVCRNVLIYFSTPLQRRVLSLFAFSLRNEGYLVLGKSETVSSLPQYFEAEDNHLRIFRRRGDAVTVPRPGLSELRHAFAEASVVRPPRQSAAVGARTPRAASEARPALTERDARWTAAFQRIPFGIAIVDRRYSIRYINMAARSLLGVYGRAIGDDIVHLAQHCRNADLLSALQRVFRSNEQVELPDVRYVEPPDQIEHRLDIVCQPYTDDASGDADVYAVLSVKDVTTQ